MRQGTLESRKITESLNIGCIIVKTSFLIILKTFFVFIDHLKNTYHLKASYRLFKLLISIIKIRWIVIRPDDSRYLWFKKNGIAI